MRANKTVLLILLTVLGFSLSLSRPLSASQQISNKSDNTLVIETEFERAKDFYQQKQLTKALSHFTLVIELILQSNEPNLSLLASCYHNLAQTFKHLQVFEKAAQNYSNALELYKKLNRADDIVKAYKNIAMSHNKLGNYLIALDHSLRSLELVKKQENSELEAQIQLLTAIIYRSIGDFEKSLTHIKHAELLYKAINSIPHLAEVDNQTGLIYTKLKQFDNARYFYQQTTELPIDKVKPETRAAAYREIGVIDYQTGNFKSSIKMLNIAANIYTELGLQERLAHSQLLIGKTYQKLSETQLAIESLEQAKGLAKQVNKKQWQAQALTSIAEINAETAPALATSLLQEALVHTHDYDSLEDQIEIYGLLVFVEKNQGNYFQALKYAEQRYNLRMAFVAKQESADVAREKAILESYKMERDIQALQEKVVLDSLMLEKKSGEIELVSQAHKIAELELSEKTSSNVLLSVLLGFCLLSILFVYRNFNSAKRLNRKLDHLAKIDPLTKCFNRRMLFERLDECFGGARHNEQQCIILADIDSFKSINDTYGHMKGDEILIAVSKVLQSLSKKNDCLIRFGGEEFCIYMPNTELSDATSIADKMCKAVYTQDFDGIKVTCSFGLAILEDDILSKDEFIDRADKALYVSKNKGRNRVTVWSSNLSEDIHPA